MFNCIDKMEDCDEQHSCRRIAFSVVYYFILIASGIFFCAYVLREGKSSFRHRDFFSVAALFGVAIHIPHKKSMKLGKALKCRSSPAFSSACVQLMKQQSSLREMLRKIKKVSLICFSLVCVF